MLAQEVTFHVLLEPCIEIRLQRVENSLGDEAFHDHGVLVLQHLEELRAHVGACHLLRLSTSGSFHFHITRLQGFPEACFLCCFVKLRQRLFKAFLVSSLPSCLASGGTAQQRLRLDDSRDLRLLRTLQAEVLGRFDRLDERLTCESFAATLRELADGVESFLEGLLNSLLLLAWQGVLETLAGRDFEHLLRSMHSQSLAARPVRPDHPLPQEV
mmetsp:Transcript_79119/g.109917  ORF Transcript_79119/g.109917 Transcript_79119/m.109917 type:complete len:214 (+) Transcript_79119:318-959(+)